MECSVEWAASSWSLSSFLGPFFVVNSVSSLLSENRRGINHEEETKEGRKGDQEDNSFLAKSWNYGVIMEIDLPP